MRLIATILAVALAGGCSPIMMETAPSSYDATTHGAPECGGNGWIPVYDGLQATNAFVTAYIWGNTQDTSDPGNLLVPAALVGSGVAYTVAALWGLSAREDCLDAREEWGELESAIGERLREE